MKSSVGSLVYYFMGEMSKKFKFYYKKKNKLKLNARDPNLLCNYVQLMSFLLASSRGRNVRFQPPDWFPNKVHETTHPEFEPGTSEPVGFIDSQFFLRFI
jgi:hypothetical protein